MKIPYSMKMSRIFIEIILSHDAENINFSEIIFHTNPPSLNNLSFIVEIDLKSSAVSLPPTANTPPET